MLGVLVLAFCAATPSLPPTSGALRRAFEAGRSSLVHVESKRGEGLGIWVGSTGEVLTSVQFVGLEEALVRFGESALPARVRFARAELGVALVTVQAEGPFPALAVHSGKLPSAGWVVVVSQRKGRGPVPHLARIQKNKSTVQEGFFDLNIAVAPGSPVLTEEGRLLGMVVGRNRQGGTRALSLATLRAQLAATP